MTTPDALVVGAGPAGTATALTLARAGHNVLILERARFPRDKACGEGLLPPGVAVLRRLDILDAVLDTGARPLHGVTYGHLGSEMVAHGSFPMPPGSGPPWGLGVRRVHFDAALADRAGLHPRVTVAEGVRASAVLRDPARRVRGVVTSDGPIEARVTVAADGLHSTLRRSAGWDDRTRPGGRYGIAGHWGVDTSGISGISVTFGHLHEWYQAPVGPAELLVSALGDRATIGRIARAYAKSARRALRRLEGAEMIAGPLSAGRFNQHPRRVAGDGLFLVGDAAGYHDPATGEGIGLALLLGEALGSILASMLHGSVSRHSAEIAYRRRHAWLSRDRNRLTTLALFHASRPRLSQRVLDSFQSRPQLLETLLGINCGYWGFGRLSMGDAAALIGLSWPDRRPPAPGE